MTFTTRTLTALGALMLAAPLMTAPAAAQDAADCGGYADTVVFGDLDWDSNAFHTQVARFILENGYGCETDAIPGSTIPILAGVVRGDIDIAMEVWTSNLPEVWAEGLAEGKVLNLGTNFPDATEGWFVPRYLVEGEDAAAPDLKAVSDLPKYKDLFADPEEPGKGRFYNCLTGWACEVTNTKKLNVYGLLDDYTNFRPGSGAALAAAIESAYKREQPVVGYYWGPTALLGKLDLVQLEEPAYDKEVWDTLISTDEPTEATAYPSTEVVLTANAEFAEAAPAIIDFLKGYETSNDVVSKALAYMEENDAEPEDAAKWFLENNEDLWTAWVPADVVERVKAAL